MSLKLVGVTACPTGIAHTFMAAEKLEKTAKTLGHTMKVETNGSGGAENVLTKDEIAAADVVIIAADTKVETKRFAGKKVLFASVSDGIKNAKALIEKAEAGEIPVFQVDQPKASEPKPSSVKPEGEKSKGFFKSLFGKK